MTVDVELAPVDVLVHQGGDTAQHPDNAHDMIRMAVGDKHVMKMIEVRLRPLHLPQDAVTAPGIGEKIFPFGSSPHYLRDYVG